VQLLSLLWQLLRQRRQKAVLKVLPSVASRAILLDTMEFWERRPVMRVMLYEAHHQPEAKHPKSSAIHKLGRPITPSIGGKADMCRIPPNVRYPL
jgi:hypothetical protein